MNIAIITGASSGMGREFAKQIVNYEKKLDEIWVIARRKNRLISLRDEINVPVRVLEGDLLSADFCTHVYNLINAINPSVQVLVNSAGYGRNGSVESILKKDINAQPNMIDLNCTALVRMTQMVLPFMEQGGHIINLASGSAFCPQPYFSVYAATKSFVLSFSRGLNSELKDRKIVVTAVCPGPVKTEFFADQNMKPAKWKEPFMASSDKVVGKALKDAYTKRSMSVYGFSMKFMRIITKAVPNSWIITITAKLQKGK